MQECAREGAGKLTHIPKQECRSVLEYYREAIKAETVLGFTRVNIVDRVQGIERISNTRKVESRAKEGGNTFDETFAKEQSKRTSAYEDKSVTASKAYDFARAVSFYNNRAMESYYYMVNSTTDLRG